MEGSRMSRRDAKGMGAESSGDKQIGLGVDIAGMWFWFHWRQWRILWQNSPIGYGNTCWIHLLSKWWCFIG